MMMTMIIKYEELTNEQAKNEIKLQQSFNMIHKNDVIVVITTAMKIAESPGRRCFLFRTKFMPEIEGSVKEKEMKNFNCYSAMLRVMRMFHFISFF